MLSQHYVNIYRIDRRITYSEKLRHLLNSFLIHGLLVVGTVVALLVDYISTRYLAAMYVFSELGVVRFGLTFSYRTWLRHFARLSHLSGSARASGSRVRIETLLLRPC